MTVRELEIHQLDMIITNFRKELKHVHRLFNQSINIKPR